MHKLRSMTETIKMLSKENESLRGENDDLLRHAKNSSIEDNQGGKQGGKGYSTNTNKRYFRNEFTRVSLSVRYIISYWAVFWPLH